MRMLIPLSLIAALAVTPAIAEEEDSAEPAAPTIDAVIPSAELPAAPESDATVPTASAAESQEAPAEESTPPDRKSVV